MTEAYDSRTALVVVDMQNDFGHPAGGLHVPGGEEVLEDVNAEIAAAKDAGALICYTQDWHPAETPHFAKDGGVWPVHCVSETWGAGLLPDLRIEGPVVRKGTGGEDGYSGFTVRHPVTDESWETELAQLLRGAGVTRVVVVGLAGDYCVKATALDARALGFETVVPWRATRCVELQPGDAERTRDELVAAGVTVTD